MNIEDQVKFATTQPAEAASNIENSKLFSVGPDPYAENKQNFQTEAEILKIPTQASKSVAEYSTRSSQHVSLIKNDINTLSKADVILKSAGDKINGVDNNQRILDLENKKKFNSSQFTEDDEINLYMLQEEKASLKNFQSLGPTKPGKHYIVTGKQIGRAHV